MKESSEKNPIESEVYEALKGVLDPEVGLNIVDMGLLYNITATTEEIHISMTLTSPGCPMGDMIMEDVEDTVKAIAPDAKVMVALTWDPAWSSEMISKEGRRFLGMPVL